MKKTLLTSVFFFMTFLSCWAQYVVRNESELLKLKELPQEKAFVDHTGPMVFSGEYLYYAFSCFNTQNNKLSTISKIGYVALVNESKDYIFEQKIKLEKGTASGDFFVHTGIPSGIYKLLGYTQWMKNSGVTQVYKDDIIILNPYQTDQSTLRKGSETSTSFRTQKDIGKTEIDSSFLSITTTKTVYGPREKVNLSIKNYKNRLGFGIYSLKVIKKEEIPVRPSMSAIEYATEYLTADKEIPQGIGDSLFLPEQRGELFFGNISDELTGESVADVDVVISVPGEEFLLKFSLTDLYGNFYSYLRKDYSSLEAILQAYDPVKSYNIDIGKPLNFDISGVTFPDFQLSKTDAEYIIKRSVRNQIENHFYNAKPDSILQGDPIDPFDGGIPEVVLLDEYTRFPTFEETLLEIVENAGYRKRGTNNQYIKVAQDFETFDEEFNNFPAIVLFDGVYIPNHESIKSFDARKIEKISLIRDRFRMGGTYYQGLLSVETFDGDFHEGYTGKNALTVKLDRPLQKKNYFKQKYSPVDTRFSRIPDYRSLLLWEPKIIIDGSSHDLEFYSSDIEGEYEIILNGFTTYGKPISITKTIEVSSEASKM